MSVTGDERRRDKYTRNNRVFAEVGFLYDGGCVGGCERVSVAAAVAAAVSRDGSYLARVLAMVA